MAVDIGPIQIIKLGNSNFWELGICQVLFIKKDILLTIYVNIIIDSLIVDIKMEVNIDETKCIDCRWWI